MASSMTTRRLNFRLLPVLIGVFTLTLGLKTVSIWKGFSDISLITPAIAEPTEKAEEKSGHGGEETEGEGEKYVPVRAEETDAAVAESDLNSSLFTKQELELLQNLSDRREELEDRSRTLDMREQMIQVSELRVEEKIQELKKLEQQINNILKIHDEGEEKQLDSLVKIYQSMKPKDAARIINGLDMEIMLDVAQRMKETKMAPILAAMNADTARKLTTELASRQPLIKD